MKNKNMTKRSPDNTCWRRETERGRSKKTSDILGPEEAAILVTDSRRDGSTKPAWITDRNPRKDGERGQSRDPPKTQTDFTPILPAHF